jgi:hypothetical protein
MHNHASLITDHHAGIDLESGERAAATIRPT